MAITWDLLLLSVSLWDFFIFFYVVYQVCSNCMSLVLQFVLPARILLIAEDGSYLSPLILVIRHISNAIQKRDLLYRRL